MTTSTAPSPATMAAGRRQLNRNHDARDQIDKRQPFENRTGTFTGEAMRLEFGQRVRIDYGALPAAHVATIVEAINQRAADAREHGGAAMLYIVRSYGTVIAWTFAAPVDWSTPARDSLTIPNVRHSATTSGHQHIVHQANGAHWATLEGAGTA